MAGPWSRCHSQDVRLGGQPGPQGLDSFLSKILAVSVQQQAMLAMTPKFVPPKEQINPRNSRFLGFRYPLPSGTSRPSAPCSSFQQGKKNGGGSNQQHSFISDSPKNQSPKLFLKMSVPIQKGKQREGAPNAALPLLWRELILELDVLEVTECRTLDSLDFTGGYCIPFQTFRLFSAFPIKFSCHTSELHHILKQSNCVGTRNSLYI